MAFYTSSLQDDSTSKPLFTTIYKELLHKIYPNTPASCCRYAAPSADSSHIFWSCPRIISFWNEEIAFILMVTTIPFPLTEEMCLLHLVDPLAHRCIVRTLLGLLFFYAQPLCSNGNHQLSHLLISGNVKLIQPYRYIRPPICPEGVPKSFTRCGIYGWQLQLQIQDDWGDAIWECCSFSCSWDHHL